MHPRAWRAEHGALESLGCRDRARCAVAGEGGCGTSAVAASWTRTRSMSPLTDSRRRRTCCSAASGAGPTSSSLDTRPLTVRTSSQAADPPRPSADVARGDPHPLVAPLDGVDSHLTRAGRRLQLRRGPRSDVAAAGSTRSDVPAVPISTSPEPLLTVAAPVTDPISMSPQPVATSRSPDAAPIRRFPLPACRLAAGVIWPTVRAPLPGEIVVVPYSPRAMISAEPGPMRRPARVVRSPAGRGRPSGPATRRAASRARRCRSSRALSKTTGSLR